MRTTEHTEHTEKKQSNTSVCSVCSVVYKFPDQAKYGKILPKSKIYKHASPTARTRDLFVRQVEKIIWSYKLSPDTINLSASKDIQEIQVFTIKQRTKSLKNDILQTIDKAIPSPILFSLSFENSTRYAAAYKRPSDSDKNKWVVSSYFKTDWIPDDSERIELPIVFNMGALYEYFLKDLIPLKARSDENLQDLVDREEQIRKLEREAVKLKSRLKKEKQFNRRVELNQSHNELKQGIEKLKKPEFYFLPSSRIL